MIIACVADIMSRNDEKIVLINVIGTLEALKRNKVSIDEAEKFLFSPHVIAKLQNKKCDEKIIDILERGCELEDIKSLIPNRMLKTINELENKALELLNDYPNFNRTAWLEW